MDTVFLYWKMSFLIKETQIYKEINSVHIIDLSYFFKKIRHY